MYRDPLSHKVVTKIYKVNISNQVGINIDKDSHKRMHTKSKVRRHCADAHEEQDTFVSRVSGSNENDWIKEI